jgi:flagellin-like protein
MQGTRPSWHWQLVIAAVSAGIALVLQVVVWSTGQTQSGPVGSVVGLAVLIAVVFAAAGIWGAASAKRRRG